MSDLNEHLAEQIKFLVKNDKNIHVLKTLLEVYNDVITHNFLKNLFNDGDFQPTIPIEDHLVQVISRKEAEFRKMYDCCNDDSDDDSDLLDRLEWSCKELSEELSEQVEILECLNDELKEQIETLEEHAGDLEEQNEELKERNEYLEEQAEDLEEQTEDLEEQNDNMSIDACCNSSDDESDTLEIREWSCKEPSEELSEQVEILECLNDELKEQIETLEEHAGDLEEQNEELKERNEYLEKQTEDLEEQAGNLEEQNENILEVFTEALLQLLPPPYASTKINSASLLMMDYLNSLDDLSGISCLNKLVPLMWHHNKDFFKRIMTSPHFIISPRVIEEMNLAFKYIINNNIEMNEFNTRMLLVSYLENQRGITVAEFKRYTTAVGFTNFDKFVQKHYLDQAQKNIAEFK